MSAFDPLRTLAAFTTTGAMRSVLAFGICATIAGCDAPSEPRLASEKGAFDGAGARIADVRMVGEYLCTVAEKASIESLHLEGAGPPTAVVDDRLPTRFRLGISEGKGANAQELRLVELPYEGADRDPTEWHTANTVLHSAYVGDGRSFISTERDAEDFFVLGPTVHSSVDGDLAFYHSGFEWAGGEDAFLSIRWGRCKKS
jgi:hypothetical protein